MAAAKQYAPTGFGHAAARAEQWVPELSMGWVDPWVEQFAGHCHIVAIAADIQETTQDRTVCSQLSRLLAVATPDTCFFFFSLSFRIARTSLSRYSFCKVSSKSLTLRHLNLFV